MATVLYLPLDERFATRDTFINLAQLTPYQIITPPKKLLSQQKQPADLSRLHTWIDNHIAQVDCLLVSAEMFLYGGLIPSRISNDSLATLNNRLEKLKNYKEQYPELDIYLSTVIMRIPDYNLAVEEPQFWANYGTDIFNYSYYQHKYQVEGKQHDQQQAQKYKANVPTKYLDEFLWRRDRNHQVTKNILQLQADTNLCREIYITLDDNAPFGFNKQEETAIRQLVADHSLTETVNIYPGADEVGLTMLARLVTDQQAITPRFEIVYRNPAGKQSIPNYEGQPLADTITDHITGAGGQIVNQRPDITLLVNNFDQQQKEASAQTPTADYDKFTTEIQTKSLFGIADVRYSNGGDKSLFNWLTNQNFSLTNTGYAGWNTAGNTLGTVISNLILLQLFSNYSANKSFTILRWLEDLKYQSIIRPQLVNYIQQTEDSIFDLSSNLDFYTTFVKKRLDYELKKMKEDYQLAYQVDQLYFPWQRTFEIGLTLQEG